MVKYHDASLNRTFSALADPTRRAIVQRLCTSGALTVSEIAKPFDISLPGVMKHIDALCEAGLVTREKAGRSVTCRFTADPMEEAMRWLEHYQNFWSTSLDNLEAYLENDQPCPIEHDQASPSNATSKQRPKKSSKRGRKRNI